MQSKDGAENCRALFTWNAIQAKKNPRQAGFFGYDNLPIAVGPAVATIGRRPFGAVTRCAACVAVVFGRAGLAGVTAFAARLGVAVA